MPISEMYTEYPVCVHVEFYIHTQVPPRPSDRNSLNQGISYIQNSDSQTEICVDTETVTTHRPSHAPEPHLPGGGHSPKGATTPPRFPWKEVIPVTIQHGTKRMSKLLAFFSKKSETTCQRTGQWLTTPLYNEGEQPVNKFPRNI